MCEADRCYVSDQFLHWCHWATKTISVQPMDAYLVRWNGQAPRQPLHLQIAVHLLHAWNELASFGCLEQLLNHIFLLSAEHHDPEYQDFAITDCKRCEPSSATGHARIISTLCMDLHDQRAWKNAVQWMIKQKCFRGNCSQMSMKNLDFSNLHA